MLQTLYVHMPTCVVRPWNGTMKQDGRVIRGRVDGTCQGRWEEFGPLPRGHKV